jgi:hypothetical protein
MLLTILLTLTLLLSTADASSNKGVEVISYWNLDLQKTVEIHCPENRSHNDVFGNEENLCQSTCSDNSFCLIEEGPFRNAASTNNGISYELFKFMGIHFVNSLERVHPKEVAKLLASRNFVTLTSRSVYNLYHRLDSRTVKRNFQSLCPNFTEYPMVFIEVDDYMRSYKDIKFVLCLENGEITFSKMDTNIGK